MRTSEVRTDAEAAAGLEKRRHVEQSVAEIGFGDGAEPDDGFRLGDARDLLGVGMRGMDEAPAVVDFDVSSSRSTGRLPCAARQSSTSRVCSLT